MSDYVDQRRALLNHGDYVLKLNLPWGNYFRILTKEEFDLWVVASKGEI